MENWQNFALIKIEGETVIPSEIARLRAWELDKPIPYELFAIGTRIDSIAANARNSKDLNIAFRKFRYFKDDLRLGLQKLNVTLLRDRGSIDSEGKKQIDQENEARKESIKWSMKGVKGSGVQKPIIEFKSQSSTNNVLFNPLDAAQIFLGKVLKSVAGTIEDHFPVQNPIKVHVTIPAYNSPMDAENYRNNLSNVLEEVKKRGVDIDFSVKGTKEFLYEPYGVYYYYAAVEGKVDFKRSGGHTYFIFDMGGSTTDLAVVQVNNAGNHSTVYPIATSIEFAGANFDEYLLESLLSREKIILDDNSDAWDQALREVENVKIGLIANQEENHLLKLGESYANLSVDDLEQFVKKWWHEPENPIREEIQKFLSHAESESKTNNLFLQYSGFELVFLAGGSISLPGLFPLLESELKSYLKGKSWEDCFVQPTKAPATAVATIGLAYEVSLRTEPVASRPAGKEEDAGSFGLMSRAEKIYGKLFAGNNEELGIRHRFIGSDSLKEVVLYENGVSKINSDYDRSKYVPVSIETDSFENGFRVRLRTDFQSEVEADRVNDYLEIPKNPKVKFQENTRINLGFSHDVLSQKLNQDSGEIEVRFKPYFWNMKGLGKNDQRLDSHEKGTSKIVLTPPRIQEKEETIHVCIDFGMSNTCVAVYSSSFQFENGKDFEVISLPERKSKQASSKTVASKSGVSEAVGSKDHKGELVASTALDNDIASIDQARIDDTSNVSSSPKSEFGKDSSEDETSMAKKGRERNKNALEFDSEESGQEQEQLTSNDLVGILAKINDTLTKIHNSNLGRHGDSSSTRDLTTFSREQRVVIDPRIAAQADGSFLVANADPIDYFSPDYNFEWFKAFVEDKGFRYAEQTLRLAHAQVMNQNSKLIVLAGPPGTGKTSLVRLLAEFFDNSVTRLNGSSSPRLKVVPVSPTWFSTSSLLGGYSEIDRQFKSTDFLDFALQADYVFDQRGSAQFSDRFFACLDEFNLAHPEQYLSSILSSIEFEYGTSGSEVLICKKEVFGPNCEKDLTLRIPPNLKLFATVNTDATSKELSPKVLDRSTYIRIIPEAADVIAYFKEVASGLVTDFPSLSPFLVAFGADDRIDSPLQSISTLANLGQCPIGYRAIIRMKELLMSHPFALDKKTTASKVLEEDQIRDLIGEVCSSIFLARLPGVFSVIDKEYTEKIEEELQRIEPNSLQSYPGTRRILKGLLNGYSGQSAI